MRKMKKLVALFMCVCTVMLMAVGCGNSSSASTKADSDYDNSFCENGTPSSTLQALRKANKLVVGSSGDAPFAYIDEKTGSFDGVDAEIIKEVGKRLGIDNVEMKLIPFSELIINVNSRNIDIIADCMYTRADRAEQIYFGDIWYTQGGGLIVPENGTVKGMSDFKGSATVVGYTPGTVWQKIVEGWQSQGLIKEARATGDQTESIVALQYGKIDAYITDSTVVENLFANYPDTVKGLVLSTDYKDEETALGRIAPAVSFNDIAFMKEVDNVVEQLRTEGFIEKAFEKYGLDPGLHCITNDEKEHTVNTRTE